jgi:hypothetical protein
MDRVVRLLLALFFCASYGFCQIAYCQPPSPELPSRIETTDNGAKPPTPASDVVYVPFKNLDEAFQKPGANVVLPFDSYEKLLDAWHKSHSASSAPQAVITRADYEVTIAEETARIIARLHVTVPEKEWAEAAIHFGPAAVGSLKSEKQVLLRGKGPREYALMFPKPGDYEVELRLGARVHQSPEGRELKFSCPPTAETAIQISVPLADQTIEIKPDVATTPAADTPMGQTRVLAEVGATDHIEIHWRPAASMQPEMDLLASVENRQLITVGDGMVHADAWLTYDILRGEMAQARFELPKSYRLLDLNADGRIRHWTAEDAGKAQIITVELLNPATKQLQLEIHAEAKLESGGVTLGGAVSEGGGGIQAMDVVRQSGQIAIRHSPDLAVTVQNQQGLVRIVDTDVDAHLKGGNALSFKFYTWEFGLTLQAKEMTPRITADQQVQFVLREDELQFKNTLHYQVDRAGVFELGLKIPKGAVIDNVQSSRMKEFSVDADQGKLTIALQERALGPIDVMIQGHLPLAKGAETSLTLPVLEPVDLERETGTILVFARESIEVQTQETGLEGAQPLPITQSLRVNDSTLTGAWSYTRRPVSIPIRTVRKPARITVRSGTIIDVLPELTQIKVQLAYNVEYSAVDTFRFSVPEAISSRLQIEVAPGAESSAPIQQQTAAPPENGRVVWTVRTQREVLGEQRFQLSYDLPVQSPQDGQQPDQRQIQLQLVRPLGLEDESGKVITPISSLSGEVLLKKDRALSLTATASGGGIEQIDIRELALLPRDGALAFHYFRDDVDDPITLNMTSQQFEIQELVSTVISQGLVEVVTGEDRQATYSCRFVIRSSQRQRLLIGMPVELELLGAFLNEHEVKLEQADAQELQSLGKEWAPYWVNVARSESSDTPFRLSFQFLWHVNPTLGESRFGQGNLKLPLPVIGGDQAAPVQDLKVVLWVPEKYALVGDAPPFSIQPGRLRCPLWPKADGLRPRIPVETWISAEQNFPVQGGQLPTQDHVPYVYSTLGPASSIEVRWWKILPTTLLFSGAMALIAWILLGTRWENKLGILLLLLFAAFFYGLSDSHALFQIFRAAGPGLIFLLLLWMLHGIFHVCRAAKAGRARHYAGTEVPYAVIPPPGVFEPETKEETEVQT